MNDMPVACQSRAVTEPQRDSPQCAHWGKGSPELSLEQRGKESVILTLLSLLPIGNFQSMATPQSANADSSPKRGAKAISFPHRHSINHGDPSVS